MLAKVGAFAVGWLERQTPHGRSYSWARTVLALSTATTLAFNTGATLFPIRSAACREEEVFSVFCIVPFLYVDCVRWCAVVVLCIVATGIYPRFTAPLYLWIAFSFVASSRTLDGGDQIASNLALLLVPVAAIDRRRWHWSAPIGRRTASPSLVLLWLLGCSSAVAIKWQVSVVYLEAAIGKVRLEEWRAGTALSVWLLDPHYGTAAFLRPLVRGILEIVPALKLSTWGVIGAEFLLAAAVVCGPTLRRVAFWIGVAMHVGIGLLLGLPTFSAVMIAALLLYLRPSDIKVNRSSMSGIRPDVQPCRDLDRNGGKAG